MKSEDPSAKRTQQQKKKVYQGKVGIDNSRDLRDDDDDDDHPRDDDDNDDLRDDDDNPRDNDDDLREHDPPLSFLLPFSFLKSSCMELFIFPCTIKVFTREGLKNKFKKIKRPRETVLGRTTMYLDMSVLKDFTEPSTNLYTRQISKTKSTPSANLVTGVNNTRITTKVTAT
eukprot:jgi/Psemu1/12378/gm1.12378_g